MGDPPIRFVFAALAALTLPPALMARALVISRLKNTSRPLEVQARWQQAWRSFAHALLLTGMLTGSARTSDCLCLTVLYMVLDLSASAWEAEGDLSPVNLIHHGSTILAGVSLLLSPELYALAGSVARNFLWMEVSTIFLNLYTLCKIAKANPSLVSGLRNLFAITFIVVRLLVVPFSLVMWANGQGAPWRRLPHLIRGCVWALMGLQWFWCAKLTCCSRARRVEC